MTRSPEARAAVSDVDCTGRQALITGSTSGIGRAAALALARLGADVIVHGRDKRAGDALLEEMTDAGGTATFVQADFAEVDAVSALAETVRAETDGLDVLVNNAGGFFREGRLTALDVEYTFHVNHLAPYLLTSDLLEHLRPGARVVTTASAAHQAADLDLERTRHLEGYSGTWAYSHSKLANVLFGAELDRRLEEHGRDVTSNSLHPGAIPGSGFSRFLPGPLPRLLKPFDALPGVTSVADGAAALCFAAVSPRLEGVSGRYFSEQRLGTPSATARDRECARRLWTYSADVLGIDEPLASLGQPVETG